MNNKLINDFFNNKYRNFFYENPKSVIIFISCIKEAHFTQEIANVWFKEGSPIFSKDNTISKMINKNLIVLEKKDNKTYYYRTNISIIIKILSEIYQQDENDIHQKIKNNNYIDYFDINYLKDIFENSKKIEKNGIDYLNYIFINIK